MKKLETTLTDHLEGFIQEKVDLSKYETSFRRWLVCEIESGLMSWQEARSRFNLPHRFDKAYKEWQKKYSDQIILTLPLMSAEERTNNQELEKRVRELEKQLELAQMKVVALNTIIDIAEKNYKLEIRKKSGPKQ
jgi:polyhydroxyalkanoate synthesis regulator phasin